MRANIDSPPRLWLTALIAVALYLGVYSLMLERKVYRPAGVDAATGQNLFQVEPQYRETGRFVATIFSPAHRVDRFMRSDFWTTIEHSNGRRWKNPDQQTP